MTAFTDKLGELMSSEPVKISTALVMTVALSKTNPELFDTDLLENGDEEQNEAVRAVVGGLALLAKLGELPQEGLTQGIHDTLSDERLRFVLLGTALEVINTAQEDNTIIADMERMLKNL